ncbi:NAD(P)-dependent oxidoreductase [Sinomicrobium soli]|uniref:NAD(P)-dependent oxidoreductase n=1 Tax=Sinomicrobium sp. N-1-3-6 TaxID=2219864 RepID=UPI000DCB697B|nr:NAD(P)H-binding protein [Sinomicrobium sp. N-1-3-6]RAV29046.1 NAD(P)-dependent oxidoreductase [Sinomicrobium sp. N-1-3-6]
MNISIIGASAGIGLETVRRALDRRHTVITLSRSKIEIENDALTSVQGSATNKADLMKTIENTDAVLVTLGTGANMQATTLFSDFAKLLIEIQRENKSDIPFVFVTGFGAGDSINYTSKPVRAFLETALKDVYADKTKMEVIVSNSNLNWIIVRPGELRDGPLTENYRVETQLYEGFDIGSINRADVADFIVKQAENPTELKKYVAISAK